MSPVLKVCICGRICDPRAMTRGRCATCARDYNRQHNSTAQHRFYNSGAWKRVRDSARRRDGQRCTHVDGRTGERCTTTSGLSVHHVTKGGDMLALENLTTRCSAHHYGLMTGADRMVRE
jgi:hypothetical protein